MAENGVLTLWSSWKRPNRSFPAQTQCPFGTPPCTRREIPVEGGWPEQQHVGVLNAFAGGAILRGDAADRSPASEGIRGLTHLERDASVRVASAMRCRSRSTRSLYLRASSMKRVKTSRRKEHVSAAVADLSGTYGGAKS